MLTKGTECLLLRVKQHLIHVYIELNSQRHLKQPNLLI